MSENNTPGAGVEEIDAATIEDSPVVTVPIDDTLSVAGEAADAKATGDALALKADKSELQTAVKVNGQSADAQGLIIVTGADTKMSSTDTRTIKAAVDAVDGKTAADIPMSNAPGAATIAEAIEGSVARTAAQIAMSATDTSTVKENIDTVKGDISALEETVAGLDSKTGETIPYQSGSEETIKAHVDALATGTVKSVNEVLPNESGNVELDTVPYADNLRSEDMDQVDGSFIRRTTGGSGSLSDGNAWILRLMGNRTHDDFVPESINMTVIPMPRPTPAAITAVLDEATFEAFVDVAGTYTLNYTDEWDNDPADYGVTVSNTPIDGDSISIVWDGENDAVMTVSAVPRTAPPAITATIDRDTFVAYVSDSGTITLTFTTAWSADPALYGITVTNEPVAGDQITVVYVKEVRGTIVVAMPYALVGTGWNLYESADGYARVVRYSNTYGYKVGGTYSALAFAETEDGAQTAITPDADGLFNVPSDGFVFVTDGGADTYILTTWSDWTSGPVGDYQAYTESYVDLSMILSSFFPYGFCRVGNVRDEMDFNQKIAISRIQRVAYSAANLEAIKATGRAYEYDENYIYVVRATPTVSSIAVDNEYSVNEHGLEFFDGSDVEVYSEILYGQNLKDKLRRQVITYGMTVLDVKSMGT